MQTGTNGKGSVCWKLAAMLRASGRRTGLFVSPHIASFRERLQVDGELISEEQVMAGLARVRDAARAEGVPATFFELVTALGFSYFEQQGVDVVVMETGLGGRLDATNIVRRPLLTVITNVGLEHTRVLGSTVEAIAREKAGIAKRGSPMLIGPRVPLDVLREVCGREGAPLYVVPTGADFDAPADSDAPAEHPSDGNVDFEFDFDFGFDAENVACVKEAARILGIREPSREVLGSRPPFRFQVERAGPAAEYVLDVAHNAPALRVLLGALERHVEAEGSGRSTSTRVVLSLSSDKDVERCVAVLAEEYGFLLDFVAFAPADTPRARDPHVLHEAFAASLARANRHVPNGVFDSVAAAMAAADAFAPAKDKKKARNVPDLANPNANANAVTVTVACGSNFMMQEAHAYVVANAAGRDTHSTLNSL